MSTEKPFFAQSQRSILQLTIIFIGYSLVAAGAVGPTTDPAATSRKEPIVLRVGPRQAITTVADAARLARSGDTVQIDAGDYAGDVAIWHQDHLTVRSAGGRVRMLANGKAAEGKAIWVVKGDDFVVEGVDFSGARVPDQNGAGIRHEGGRLTVRDCRFSDNENGILGGSQGSEIVIENSEFDHNGAGDGQSHNLYIGAVTRLTVTGSYFHHARAGHLLKTRAERSYIMYNRLTDEAGGTASYELEFPNGGVAYVVGNIIEQGPHAENTVIISFGAEGYRWPQNHIVLVNNTIVDDYAGGGTFLRVVPGAGGIVALNNLLLGHDVLEAAGAGQYAGNFVVERTEFTAPSLFDFRLKRGSLLAGKTKNPGESFGMKLRPEREYVHPRHTRRLQGGPYSPGAVQSIAP